MPSLLKQFTSKDHGPVVQFIKYSIGGGLATAVHIGVFYLCAFLVLPALGANDPLIRLLHLQSPELTDAVRATNAKWDNVIAFCFSNLTAYLVNIVWVFHTGRHHWIKEFLMFTAVSGFSMIVGTALQTWLIRQFGLPTTVAFFTNCLTAMLFNYAMRKFVIFKG